MSSLAIEAWLSPVSESSNFIRIDCSSWKDPTSDLASLFKESAVFTTMRLLRKDAEVLPVAFDLHLTRLQKSGADPGVLRNLLQRLLQEKVRGKFLSFKWLGLVVVVGQPLNESSDAHIAFYLKRIPEPKPFCSVLAVDGEGRSEPAIKSTAWIEQRKAFEALKGSEYEEVLLVHSGSILEGLSSNFAVIKNDGALVTAPEELVLPGTMMAMVYEACRCLVIPVVRECSKISEIEDWSAAFITSTSRLLLPIKTLVYKEKSYELQWNQALITALQEKLNSELISDD